MFLDEMDAQTQKLIADCFSEKCTPAVEQAIPELVKMVLQELVG